MVFVHNQDIDIGKHEVLKKFRDMNDIEDVHKLVKENQGVIPRIYSSSLDSQEIVARQFDLVIFD